MQTAVSSPSGVRSRATATRGPDNLVRFGAYRQRFLTHEIVLRMHGCIVFGDHWGRLLLVSMGGGTAGLPLPHCIGQWSIYIFYGCMKSFTDFKVFCIISQLILNFAPNIILDISELLTTQYATYSTYATNTHRAVHVVCLSHSTSHTNHKVSNFAGEAGCSLYFLCPLITSAKEVVFIIVCLSVSNFVQKPPNGFAWNL